MQSEVEVYKTARSKPRLPSQPDDADIRLCVLAAAFYPVIHALRSEEQTYCGLRLTIYPERREKWGIFDEVNCGRYHQSNAYRALLKAKGL